MKCVALLSVCSLLLLLPACCWKGDNCSYQGPCEAQTTEVVVPAETQVVEEVESTEDDDELNSVMEGK